MGIDIWNIEYDHIIVSESENRVCKQKDSSKYQNKNQFLSCNKNTLACLPVSWVQCDQLRRNALRGNTVTADAIRACDSVTLNWNSKRKEEQ